MKSSTRQTLEVVSWLVGIVAGSIVILGFASGAIPTAYQYITTNFAPGPQPVQAPTINSTVTTQESPNSSSDWQGIPIGNETVSAGTIVVERLTNSNNQTVQIWFGRLPNNATFNSIGQVRLEGWKGFPAIQAAQQRFEKEYEMRTDNSPNNWSRGYTVIRSAHSFTSSTG